MKRYVLACSALFLLVVTPSVHADQAVNDVCIGPNPVTSDLTDLTALLPASLGPGAACLRTCKSGASLCTKLARARFQCLSQFTKGKARNIKLRCFADGQPRKQCTQQAAIWREDNLAPYKTGIEVDKGACAAAHLTCKAVCTP